MSKTISIPTHNNPFTVIINNREYTYKGGETIEVPDEVAEAIEDALELVPKPKVYLGKLAQRAQGDVESIVAGDLEGCSVITEYTFINCTNLRSIEIPRSVVRIGYRSICGCSKLKTVTIEEGSLLETIDSQAFAWNPFLTGIVLPENVKSIGEQAFASCKSLARVIIKAKIPPSITSDIFSDAPTTCVIEVPSEAVEAYKAAPYWSARANQIKAIEE